jgi:hypothetical protein
MGGRVARRSLPTEGHDGTLAKHSHVNTKDVHLQARCE